MERSPTTKSPTGPAAGYPHRLRLRRLACRRWGAPTGVSHGYNPEKRIFQLLRVAGRLSEAVILMLMIVLAGCGYEFGTGAKPGAAYGLRLAVPVFHNDTFEPVLDKRVTEMVRRQFLQADGLTLVNDVGAAPLALVGHIIGYGSGTIAFHSSGGGTNENRVTIAASVQLQDTATKKTVWAENYTRTAEFFLSADLAINRSRQDRATEEAAQAIAEDIVSRVLEVYSSGELK
jgi:lipopolysaccharide assembly LptE-like protein